MKPTIKAKRWWWPPDRKKAKLANVVMQHHLNAKANLEMDKWRQTLYGNSPPTVLVAKNKKQQKEWQKQYPGIEVLIEQKLPEVKP